MGAHPDDVEFLTGETLTLLYQKGFKVYIATTCKWDKGSATLSPPETTTLRFKEATRAAGILGAPFECLNVPDLGGWRDERLRDPCENLTGQWVWDVFNRNRNLPVSVNGKHLPLLHHAFSSKHIPYPDTAANGIKGFSGAVGGLSLSFLNSRRVLGSRLWLKSSHRVAQA